MSVHPKFIAFQQDIQTNPAAHPDCIISKDLILQKGHIWLPNGFNFINSLLEEFHTTPTGGNMGIKISLARLGEIFTWQSIREDVRLFIATCTYYQHTKYEASKPIGLLCPWHVPSIPWEDLSLDFIMCLPTYRGHTAILVVVD